MVASNTQSLIGVGIYGLAEAARLTKVRAPCIRRWLRGYVHKHAGETHVSGPVWKPQLPEIDGTLAVGFRDLLEVRFVDAFLKCGVCWKTLRLAAERARELLHTTHPFSTQRFKTDGRTIFAEIQHRGHELALLELTKRQQYFAQVISPYLRGVEFVEGEPARWWPLGEHRRVVLDPQRSFGQPIVEARGVPTTILFAAFRATSSFTEVARWYDVDVRSVQDAIDFEQGLAA